MLSNLSRSWGVTIPRTSESKENWRTIKNTTLLLCYMSSKCNDKVKPTTFPFKLLFSPVTHYLWCWTSYLRLNEKMTRHFIIQGLVSHHCHLQLQFANSLSVNLHNNQQANGDETCMTWKISFELIWYLEQRTVWHQNRPFGPHIQMFTIHAVRQWSICKINLYIGRDDSFQLKQ